MKNFLFGLIVGGILIFGYFFVKENPDNIYIIQAKTRINKIIKKDTPIGIANPASTYCIENNGTLEIKDEATGSIGICNFTDGSSCEERAFFRGECTPGTVNKQPNQEIINEEPTACTMEYAPVCAKVEIQCITTPCEPIEQTFGNKCMMEANKLATFLYEGECQTQKNLCPQYAQPSPDFCTEGTIEDGGTDENGCQLPPKCIIK